MFDFESRRAKKARLYDSLSGKWLMVIEASIAGLLFGGARLLFVGQSVGWLLIGLSVLPGMVYVWVEGELKALLPEEGKELIEALLSGDMLGKLPPNPTPKALAAAAGSVQGGQFMAVRLGLTPNLLANVASDAPADTEAVWKEALALRRRLGGRQVDGAIMAVALLRAFTNHEALLAHLHIDSSDLEKGVVWYRHIQELIERHAQPKGNGGIARDWSFGFIPTLTRFGNNLSDQIARGALLPVDLEAHDSVIDQMIETFASGSRQNVTLVGPAGVGKTTVVHALAERLLDAKSNLPASLKFRQIFILDPASLIAAAPGRGELESLIMRVLGEAYSAKNIIICLDNAELFFAEGVGSVDLSNVLLPILDAGRLRLILTMDEQYFLRLSQRNPALATSLNRLNVSAPSRDEIRAVMHDHLIVTEFQRKVTYTYQAVEEAYRLSERYVHDLAMPGRAIKLLDQAASYPQAGGLVTINSVQQAIEKSLNIKVSLASSASERDTLLNLETLIHKRMINQTRAVTVVSDALRRARAGVRNQNRPIGTFLFLGPTGVGKTELAKALADVYFGGEDRMIRLDLNEFVGPQDVQRLLADGADDPMSLTARMMKQPFSVVLLDEIEKAHPQVLLTLLQLLDEGILRDIKNREISFRDAIVIATSNAGADRIREYIERGHALERFERIFLDELISSKIFQPEFINRFDEVVVFTPLGEKELLQLIDLMLGGINKTLALQKVSVSVSNEAKALLVKEGYDPRLGARPLRRVVQRAVENTVARQMLSGSVMPGSQIVITREQVEQSIGAGLRAPALETPPKLEG